MLLLNSPVMIHSFETLNQLFQFFFTVTCRKLQISPKHHQLLQVLLLNQGHDCSKEKSNKRGRKRERVNNNASLGTTFKDLFILLSNPTDSLFFKNILFISGCIFFLEVSFVMCSAIGHLTPTCLLLFVIILYIYLF